jgi:hypothetical protein
MWKSMEIQNQERTYNDASQAYWEELYRAVRQDIGDYNARQHPDAQLSAGDLSGKGLDARGFPVEHNRREQSATQVTRSVDTQPHTVQIVCGVAIDGPHELELRLDKSVGRVEAYDSKEKKLTVPELVALIVNPLKSLGRVPSHEADQPMPEPPDYDSL